MLRSLRIVAAAAFPLLAASFSFGEITGSKHDFSAYDWSDKQICKPCHTPHNADVTLTKRIWAHTLSTASYSVQNGSVTGDGSTSLAGSGSKTQSNMDNATRLCLGCHDGTVALDSFRGKDGGSLGKSITDYKDDTVLYNPNIGGAAVGGTTADLSNDHPVGYGAHISQTADYYKPIASIKAAGLKVVTSPDIITSGTDINTGANLAGTNYYSVSCVTCHNVHNSGTGGAKDERGLLRVSNVGSALCLTCHNK